MYWFASAKVLNSRTKMAFMDKTTLLLVGERVLRLRKAKRWSQDALARKAGVGQKTVSNIENAGGDRDSYTMESLEKVCAAFNMPLWEMLLPDDISKEAAEFGRAWESLPSHERAALRAALSALKKLPTDNAASS